MSSTRIDFLIAKLAREHHGLVPLAPLFAAGVDTQSITRRTQSGLLLPVIRGVRRIAHAELTPVRRSIAAVLVSEGGWVSHTAALAAYGALLKSPSQISHFTCPHQVRIPGIRSHRAVAELPDVDRCQRFGVVFSRPWRAIVESAAVLDAGELAVAMDSLVQTNLASFPRVLRCAQSLGPFRGRRFLLELLHERLNGQGIVRSFLEQDLDRLLRRARLPLPTRNFAVRLPSGKRREIDTCWPSLRIGLEAHSWQFHSNPTDWGATMVRDRELTAFGWTILPVVVADTRSPEQLLSELRTLLLGGLSGSWR